MFKWETWGKNEDFSFSSNLGNGGCVNCMKFQNNDNEMGEAEFRSVFK